MTLVNQQSKLPTNKLAVAAMVGPAATQVWTAIMVDIYPPVAGEATAGLVGALAALIVGYFIRDRANV